MAFQCTVITPEQELLDQQVTYASVPAWDGLIGIATQRAPLLIKLGDGPLRLDTDSGESKLYFIGGGFAQMQNNTLSLLAGEAIPASDINVEETQAALAEAQARVSQSQDQTNRKNREVSRAKAMLHVAESA